MSSFPPPWYTKINTNNHCTNLNLVNLINSFGGLGNPPNTPIKVANAVKILLKLLYNYFTPLDILNADN